MKRVSPRSVAAAAIFLMAALASRGSDQIRVYTIPKEVPDEVVAPAPVMQPGGPVASGVGDMASQAVPTGEASAADIRWTTPSGWKELPRTAMRIGNFAIAGANGKKAEVAITSFPGSVGTELDNVNRWRRELGLAATSEAGISSEPVTVGGIEAKLYDMAGESERTVVADVMRNGASWFLKLKGDKEVVASARPAFFDFLKSVQFAGGYPGVTFPATGGGDPHAAGLQMALAEETGKSDATDSGDAAKWNPPASWREKKPGPMVLKAFTVGDGAAAVTISAFPGTVGGTLANVNRWRGQIGLAPVGESDLGTMTQTINASGEKATAVDLAGTDMETGHAARLVAVIVPHGGQTWFYKLMGDGTTVGKEKDEFLKFVETAQYR